MDLMSDYFTFLITPVFTLFKYSFKSIFTSPDRINNPNMLGNAIAKIIISEKSITAPKEEDDPTTTKSKNNILYKISAGFSPMNLLNKKVKAFTP